MEILRSLEVKLAKQKQKKQKKIMLEGALTTTIRVAG